MGEYSFRNFEVGEQFIKEFKACSKKGKQQFKCEVGVRRKHRIVESGRLNEMGDKIHKFISHLDPDEVINKKIYLNLTKLVNSWKSQNILQSIVLLVRK